VDGRGWVDLLHVAHYVLEVGIVFEVLLLEAKQLADICKFPSLFVADFE